MNSDAKQLLDLRDRAEKLKREKSRAEGALAQTLKRLRDEHDCRDLPDARKTLAKRERDIVFLQKEKDAKLKAFLSKWEGVLNDAG